VDLIVIGGLFVKHPAQPGDGPEIFVGEVQQGGPQGVNHVSLILTGVSDFHPQSFPDSGQVVYHPAVEGLPARSAIGFLPNLLADCLNQIPPGGRPTLNPPNDGQTSGEDQPGAFPRTSGHQGAPLLKH